MSTPERLEEIIFAPFSWLVDSARGLAKVKDASLDLAGVAFIPARGNQTYAAREGGGGSGGGKNEPPATVRGVVCRLCYTIVATRRMELIKCYHSPPFPLRPQPLTPPAPPSPSPSSLLYLLGGALRIELQAPPEREREREREGGRQREKGLRCLFPSFPAFIRARIADRIPSRSSSPSILVSRSYGSGYPQIPRTIIPGRARFAEGGRWG